MFTQRRVYVDAAAATPLTPLARKRLMQLLDVYGNPGAIHAEGVAAAQQLAVGRQEIANALEAHPDEIVFTASGTEANNLALFGVMAEKSGHAITTAIEHPSVLEPLRRMEGEGMVVTYLPVDEHGLLDLEALEESISEKTKLISISIINSEIGVLQDVRAIAKLVRAERKKRTLRQAQGNPIYFHIDASQAPLWIRLRVEALGCDLLTLDAQKIGGPKGIGLLYVKRGTNVSAHILGGGQEQGIRSGTENVALIGSFAAALSQAQAQCEENTKRIAPVRDYLLEQIQHILPAALANGSMEQRVANNLNVSIPGLMGERAIIALSAYGISASTRSACAAKDEDLSHVLLALGVGPVRAREAMRFTMLPTATKREMDRVVAGLSKAYALYANADHSVA